ncbi:hypothetical protein D3C71_1995800 [compost metagenome]
MSASMFLKLMVFHRARVRADAKIGASRDANVNTVDIAIRTSATFFIILGKGDWDVCQ